MESLAAVAVAIAVAVAVVLEAEAEAVCKVPRRRSGEAAIHTPVASLRPC